MQWRIASTAGALILAATIGWTTTATPVAADTDQDAPPSVTMQMDEQHTMMMANHMAMSVEGMSAAHALMEDTMGDYDETGHGGHFDSDSDTPDGMDDSMMGQMEGRSMMSGG